MQINSESSRRAFLRHAAKLAAAAAALPFAQKAMASMPSARSLTFDHTHTGEHISLIYSVNGKYVPDVLMALNEFLRDHYSGEVGVMDPSLFDLLYRMRQTLGSEEPFQVISGYRCAATNSSLRDTRGGGVATHSLHMDGKAIDLRLAGVPISDLRDVALSLRLGGVGYYQSEQFVHVDTGRVRSW